MIKILTTLFLLLSFSAKSNLTDKEWFSICEATSSAAEIVMYNRQNEVSMVDQYKLSKGDGILIMLIQRAYNIPLYTSVYDKHNTIKEFRDGVFRVCINKGNNWF